MRSARSVPANVVAFVGPVPHLAGTRPSHLPCARRWRPRAQPQATGLEPLSPRARPPSHAGPPSPCAPTW
ncbi:proline-rich receptor-like protein kinase PERK9 [Iris pallida]|uniref:Proline-rich receptor-like protein kinase PERK9 n=1 Tax=Iris pallida TaxID=29817 RepID=A0AAX6H5E8_IRIPA|nr:proline-rich receptor-like protein kinase PERK9 [Iris pallida]